MKTKKTNIKGKAVLVPERCGEENVVKMISPLTVNIFGQPYNAFVVLSGSEDNFRLEDGEPIVVRKDVTRDVSFEDSHDWYGRWKYQGALKEYEMAVNS